MAFSLPISKAVQKVIVSGLLLGAASEIGTRLTSRIGKAAGLDPPAPPEALTKTPDVAGSVTIRPDEKGVESFVRGLGTGIMSIFAPGAVAATRAADAAATAAMSQSKPSPKRAAPKESGGDGSFPRKLTCKCNGTAGTGCACNQTAGAPLKTAGHEDETGVYFTGNPLMPLGLGDSPEEKRRKDRKANEARSKKDKAEAAKKLAALQASFDAKMKAADAQTKKLLEEAKKQANRVKVAIPKMTPAQASAAANTPNWMESVVQKLVEKAITPADVPAPAAPAPAAPPPNPYAMPGMMPGMMSPFGMMPGMSPMMPGFGMQPAPMYAPDPYAQPVYADPYAYAQPPAYPPPGYGAPPPAYADPYADPYGMNYEDQAAYDLASVQGVEGVRNGKETTGFSQLAPDADDALEGAADAMTMVDSVVQGADDETGFSDLAPDVSDVMSGLMVEGEDDGVVEGLMVEGDQDDTGFSDIAPDMTDVMEGLMVEGESDETGFSDLAPDVSDVTSGLMVEGEDDGVVEGLMVEGDQDDTGFSDIAPDMADVMEGLMVEGLDMQGMTPPVCGSCAID